jgi:hypothetical protein
MFTAPNPALVLLGTLLLWLPTVRNLLDGNLNLTAGIVRFGLALAVSWFGNDLLRRVVRAYASYNTARRRPKDDDGDDGNRPGRGRGRPRPESRLTPLLEDPHPGADAVVSRLRRPAHATKEKANAGPES